MIENNLLMRAFSLADKTRYSTFDEWLPIQLNGRKNVYELMAEFPDYQYRYEPCTGLYDQNRKLIYVNDIVKLNDDPDNKQYTVIYRPDYAGYVLTHHQEITPLMNVIQHHTKTINNQIVATNITIIGQTID